MSEYVKGYAIRRNNTCESGETRCTKESTWDNFQACCPGNSFCFDSQTSIPNIICCDNHNNCTQSIAQTPKCADKSWNLFDWDGYFCCDKDESAFHVNDRVWVGCSGSDFPGNDTYDTLDVISSASDTSISTSTATSSSTPTSSLTSSPTFSSPAKAESSSSGSSSHTNTGAIAGGVVGGVVGAAAIIALLFFFIRRRKQQTHRSQEQVQDQGYSQSGSPVVYSEIGENYKPKELDGHTRSEIASGEVSTKEPHELPAGH